MYKAPKRGNRSDIFSSRFAVFLIQVPPNIMVENVKAIKLTRPYIGTVISDFMRKISIHLVVSKLRRMVNSWHHGSPCRNIFVRSTTQRAPPSNCESSGYPYVITISAAVLADDSFLCLLSFHWPVTIVLFLFWLLPMIPSCVLALVLHLAFLQRFTPPPSTFGKRTQVDIGEKDGLERLLHLV